MSKREQAAYLVELLGQETASSLKRGVNRFDVLLDPFGLAGSTKDKAAEHLFELQQIRNAVAHQNGRCDRRLKANCPWLKLKLHSPIRISAQQIGSYFEATGEYTLELLYRIGDQYGADLRATADGAGQSAEPAIEETGEVFADQVSHPEVLPSVSLPLLRSMSCPADLRVCNHFVLACARRVRRVETSASASSRSRIRERWDMPRNALSKSRL